MAIATASRTFRASTVLRVGASASADNSFAFFTHWVPNQENLFQRSDKWSDK